LFIMITFVVMESKEEGQLFSKLLNITN
jgi:hypothetical protein